MIFAYAVVTRHANQLAAGLSLMIFGIGLSALIGGPFIGELISGLPSLSIPGLDPDGLGVRLLSYDALVYLVVPTSVLIWWLIFRTRWGLGLRAVGEDPAVAFAAGLKPDVLRYQALAVAGALGGIGGAHMSIALTLSWAEGMTAGRGFIAIALVIFAKWNPLLGHRRGAVIRRRRGPAAPASGRRRRRLAVLDEHDAVFADAVGARPVGMAAPVGGAGRAWPHLCRGRIACIEKLSRRCRAAAR